MTYDAIDCMGFAGGFTLGTVQAGFNLIGKRELKGGFGVANCEANRHLLGDGWRSQVGSLGDWTAPTAQLVFGNPPCSGFSVMSAPDFRGAQSVVNQCMWTFVAYAARVKPEVVIFESVQQAFTRPDGLALMRDLRDHLETLSGERYDLYHVRHNAYSVGGCAQRRRYFWVASRIPFGIEHPDVDFDALPVLNDAIGDLSDLPLQWGSQSYQRDAAPWATQLRSPSGAVDGHIGADNGFTRRLNSTLSMIDWPSKGHLGGVLKQYYEQHGALPEPWISYTDRYIEKDFRLGFVTPVRWSGVEPARVVTGAGLFTAIHPTQPRLMTHREIARILGFPDDWLIEPLRGVPQLSATWGKGISVHCGRWIANWAKCALDGNPGTFKGSQLGEREWDIDVTHAWNPQRAQRSAGTSSRFDTMKSTTVRRVTPRVASLLGAYVSEIENVEGTETQVDVQIGAGRPRSTETKTRDADVYNTLLDRGPMTRRALASLLDVDGNLVYMSLYRLRMSDKVLLDGKLWHAVVPANSGEIATETEAPVEADAAA